MKKFIRPLCLILITCLLSTGLVSCFGGKTDSVGIAYITLRVNPEIELVVNEDMEVISANAINEDGEILISELNLIGKDIDDAAEEFAKKAAELGYIDVEADETVVYVDVSCENEELYEEIIDDVIEKVTDFFDNNGINGKTNIENIEKYAELVNRWGVTYSNAKIIARVLDLYPEMTEQEVLLLTVSERINLLREYAQNNPITPDLNDEYKEEVEEVKDSYSELFGIDQRLDILKAALESVSLTEEEMEIIKEEYEILKARRNELREKYLEEIKRVREEYLERTAERREAARKAAQERREKNAELFNKYFENVKSQRKKSLELIRAIRQIFLP